MEIYIDHNFIEKFSSHTSHPLHQKLLNFLKKPQSGQKYINFESVEAFKEAALQNPMRV